SHGAGKHMAVIAVGGEGRVALLERGVDADDDRRLADIEVAEPTNQPHPVHLTGALFKAADQQHVGIPALERLGRDLRIGWFNPIRLAGDGHSWHSSGLSRSMVANPAVCNLRGSGGRAAKQAFRGASGYRPRPRPFLV